MTEDTPDLYGIRSGADGARAPAVTDDLPTIAEGPTELNDEPGPSPPLWQRQERLPAPDVREVAGVNLYRILFGKGRGRRGKRRPGVAAPAGTIAVIEPTVAQTQRVRRQDVAGQSDALDRTGTVPRESLAGRQFDDLTRTEA